MNYDPIRGILAASSEELGRLLEVAIPQTRTDDPAGTEPTGPPAALTEAERREWTGAGVLLDDVVHPTVLGMVTVLARPVRSVVIERFSRNVVIPLFVAWGPQGRATLTDGIPGGDVTVQATSFDLLAPLVMQALHLHRGIPAPEDRRSITTTAGAMEEWFDPEAGFAEAGGDGLPGELAANLRFAWRASGGWPGGEVDTSVTAFSAGPLGLWTVSHRGQQQGDGAAKAPSPDTEVVMRPTTVSALTARLGDVITGREAAAPQPDRDGVTPTG